MANITAKIQRLLKQTARMKMRATKSLLKTLKQIDQERKVRTADLDQAAHVIGQQLAELGHKFTHTAAKTKPTNGKASASKRRVRRSPAQLKKYADGVYQFIKSHPDCKGGAIRKAFPGVGQNIAGFVANYTGKKLGTKGKKAAMTYHVN